MLEFILGFLASVLLRPHCSNKPVDSNTSNRMFLPVGNRVSSCNLVSRRMGCSNHYEFEYNRTTAVIETPAHYCRDSGVGDVCITGNEYLLPCHMAKVGGPDGKICSNFTNQASCVRYYADDEGDRWCEWIDDSRCVGNTICHN